MRYPRLNGLGLLALSLAIGGAAAAGCSDDDTSTPGTTVTGSGAGGVGGASGGTGGTAAGGATGGAGGQAPTPWQFFVIGDPRSDWDTFEDNTRSMWALDPTAVACFSAGDLTPVGDRDEWDDHHQALADGAPDTSVPADPLGIVRQSHFRTDVSNFGDYIWYLGAVGNHDDGNSSWYTNWNDYLPGQASLGVNSEDGIYFTLSYDNALFIMLDSVHDSDEQTTWLEGVLTSAEAAAATWKFAFWHHPIYPCNLKTPQGRLLEWAPLFEQHGLDIAFVGDSHTYERTCPMVEGSCAEGGVIYFNTSGGGAGVRDVYDTMTATVSNSDRSDDYDCAQILDSYQGNWHHFTHVAIDGCTLTTNAYSHDHHTSQEASFDSLVIDKCN